MSWMYFFFLLSFCYLMSFHSNLIILALFQSTHHFSFQVSLSIHMSQWTTLAMVNGIYRDKRLNVTAMFIVQSTEYIKTSLFIPEICYSVSDDVTHQTPQKQHSSNFACKTKTRWLLLYYIIHISKMILQYYIIYNKHIVRTACQKCRAVSNGLLESNGRIVIVTYAYI